MYALRSKFPFLVVTLVVLTLTLPSCGGSPKRDGTDGGTNDPDGSIVDGGISEGCGDGTKGANEECDDGNTTDADGCSASCAVEDTFVCPAEGQECVQVVVCGNGRIEGSETCDDRNTESEDGCSDTCQVEPGWSCPVAGTACVATACGDGFVAGFELCDDGNTENLDGCDAQCKLEEGSHCPVPGDACLPTDCGDGLVQGTEECDDQNVEVGDGCTPFCKREPQCTDGVCLAVCGDGIRFAPEECDDGNRLSGDGCDADCFVEQGFSCVEIELEAPEAVELPVTVRDFVAACNVTGSDRRLADDESGAVAPFGHRDFQCFSGGRTGMVGDVLDVDGKPERIANDVTFSDASFSQWYRSDNDYNRTFATSLTLPETAVDSGAYRFDSNSLYPATGIGFDVEDCDGAPCESLHADGNSAGPQNFHFTTETRWWFEYSGNEVLAFSGDDDVWVFINDRLAVDIGGVHGREDGSVNLGVAETATNLGLTAGGIYEAVVFHAERHTTRSQYRLTLTNFVQAPSDCTDECGDEVVSSREVCDQGTNNGLGDGSPYGGCTADCTLEPHCGDGIVDTDFGETCDDGLNLGGAASECAPGCQGVGSACGDGVLQTDAGEQCDDGNTTSLDGCSEDCAIEID